MRRSVRLIRMYSRISYDLIRNILRLNKLCKSETRIDGKVVIITGANSGIGKETAYQLSLRGAKVYNHPLEGDSHLTVSQVIMACRDVDKADKAKEDILFRNENAELVVAHLDLSSLDSVRNFAQLVDQNEKKVDILINNAGVMMCPESKTADGHEMQFGTNYLGHFLLTLLLLKKLKQSPHSRVINISSVLYIAGKIHFNDINLKNEKYTPVKAYCQSKLALVLFTRELSEQLGPHSTVRVYCLHPGLIRTNLFRNFPPFYKFFNKMAKKFYSKPKSGAQTTLFCALEDELQNPSLSGHYFSNCDKSDVLISKACDRRSSRRLWQLSCHLVGLPFDFVSDLDS